MIGDSLKNSITASRDAAGNLLINGGAVPIEGGAATVANTSIIQVFSHGDDDTIALDETNGALPAAQLFGGDGNDVLIGGDGNDVITGGRGNDTANLGAGSATRWRAVGSPSAVCNPWSRPRD